MRKTVLSASAEVTRSYGQLVSPFSDIIPRIVSQNAWFYNSAHERDLKLRLPVLFARLMMSTMARSAISHAGGLLPLSLGGSAQNPFPPNTTPRICAQNHFPRPQLHLAHASDRPALIRPHVHNDSSLLSTICPKKTHRTVPNTPKKAGPRTYRHDLKKFNACWDWEPPTHAVVSESAVTPTSGRTGGMRGTHRPRTRRWYQTQPCTRPNTNQMSQSPKMPSPTPQSPGKRQASQATSTLAWETNVSSSQPLRSSKAFVCHEKAPYHAATLERRRTLPSFVPEQAATRFRRTSHAHDYGPTSEGHDRCAYVASVCPSRDPHIQGGACREHKAKNNSRQEPGAAVPRPKSRSVPPTDPRTALPRREGGVGGG